jgi:hypothetical protein
MDFLLPPLILAAILAVVVYSIVRYQRQRRLGAVDPGIGIVRRLYFYLVSFAALMMTANGVVQIIRYIVESLFGGDLISGSQTGLAVGMSLTLVGLPLWLFHWRTVQRHVGEMPVEVRSAVRKFYIYLVLGVSVGLLVASSVELLRWAFRLEEFKGWPWGSMIIWGAVWVFHWRVEGEEGQPNEETMGIRRIYLYAVSLVGIVMGASGLGMIAHIVLSGGYDALIARTVLLSDESGLWSESTRGALAQALVGGAAWGAHWLYFARNDLRSLLREAYIYLFAILGGVVTSLVSAGIIIFGLLTWILDVPTNDVAADHFRFLPGAVASLCIGAGIWGYHWSLARQEAQVAGAGLWSARRAYGYILAAVGLGALAIGVARLVNTTLTVITESGLPKLAGQDLWREPIALSVTLFILGAPLWGYYWTTIQRRLEEGGAPERASGERRVFIFAALGVGVVALLIAASALLFFVFRDALAESLSRETLRDARPSIDTIVAVAIFLPYYWLVYRKDQRAELEAAQAEGDRRPRKAVSILVNEGGSAFVRDLEAALGYGVDVLRWVDPDARLPLLNATERDELAQRIHDAAGRNVLLVPTGTAVRVLSYE